VKKALKLLERAASQLSNVESTTVNEGVALLNGIHDFKGQVMRCGLRAREALRREEQEHAG
jgi:hypothetical protein